MKREFECCNCCDDWCKSLSERGQLHYCPCPICTPELAMKWEQEEMYITKKPR